MFRLHIFAAWVALVWGTLMAPRIGADEIASALSEYNASVPFCYQEHGIRAWPILRRDLLPDESLALTLRLDGKQIDRGTSISSHGLTFSIGEGNTLRVDARSELPDTKGLEFEIELNLLRGDVAQDTQRLVVRRAPPPAPVSYIADLVDDLIRTFAQPEAGRFQPISKQAFDQYFRRLQAHGVSRLIVWHSPFPFFTKPEDHDPTHWARYEQQARAIIENEALDRVLSESRTLPSWLWLRFVLALRLNPEAGPMFARSASEHGISLTASFRPFESALTKYYEVPAFDDAGEYLWGFLPLAVPLVNYEPHRVGFGHYRVLLDMLNKADTGRLAIMELPGMTEAEVTALTERFGPTGGFQLRGAHFPPIDPDSFVLVRQPDETFQLQPFRAVQELAESRRLVIDGFQLERSADGVSQLADIKIPDHVRFLSLTHVAEPNDRQAVTLDRDIPVRLRAAERNRLNRETIFRVFEPATPAGRESRIAGITADGQFRAVFQASVASIQFQNSQPMRVPLGGHEVVVDRGPLWSVEMLDFQQPDARRMAVTQLRTLLSLSASESHPPAYDEILISTRSHVDLAPTMADGEDGQQLIAHYYRTSGAIRHHLGLDKAFAPRSVVNNPRMQELVRDPESVERITTWQEGEWRGTCQAEDSPLVWRLSRNLAVGEGMSQLLRDLEREFPQTRIRAIVPPKASSVQRLEASLDRLPAADGGTYGRDYYRRLWSSNNHIPAIGEGMALVDLTGTNIEPVFLGSGGYLPDLEPLERFVSAQIDDLADNRGSAFRGPRSYFFEGQFTLRSADPVATRKQRDMLMRYLLAQTEEIREILLYEAADWLYFLPLSDPAPWSSLAP